MKSLTVFIPALNEEKHIGNVIKEIPVREIRKKGFKVEILVVNGPSTDRTEEIARKSSESYPKAHPKTLWSDTVLVYPDEVSPRFSIHRILRISTRRIMIESLSSAVNLSVHYLDVCPVGITNIVIRKTLRARAARIP